MLADKLGDILTTRAEYCTAADNSCLMHIGGALHRKYPGVRTIHLAEILASTEPAPAQGPHEPRSVLDPRIAPPFPKRRCPSSATTQLRKNVATPPT